MSEENKPDRIESVWTIGNEIKVRATLGGEECFLTVGTQELKRLLPYRPEKPRECPIGRCQG